MEATTSQYRPVRHDFSSIGMQNRRTHTLASTRNSKRWRHAAFFLLNKIRPLSPQSHRLSMIVGTHKLTLPKFLVATLSPCLSFCAPTESFWPIDSTILVKIPTPETIAHGNWRGFCSVCVCVSTSKQPRVSNQIW